MTLAQLVAQLVGLYIGCIGLAVKGIGADRQRRNLRIELALEYLYLTGCIVIHLARGGTVGHQFLVALPVLQRLGQLLARGGNLLLHLRFLTLIDTLGGIRLLELQPNPGSIDEPYLAVGSEGVALGYTEGHQGTILFGIHRGLGGLKHTGSIKVCLFITTGMEHQCHTCHCQ